MTNVISPAGSGASQPRHGGVAEPVELLHGVGEVPVPFPRLGRRPLVFLLQSLEALLRFLERRGLLVRLLLKLREPPVLRRHALLERCGRRLALLDLPAKRGGFGSLPPEPSVQPAQSSRPRQDERLAPRCSGSPGTPSRSPAPPGAGSTPRRYPHARRGSRRHTELPELVGEREAALFQLRELLPPPGPLAGRLEPQAREGRLDFDLSGADTRGVLALSRSGGRFRPLSERRALGRPGRLAAPLREDRPQDRPEGRPPERPRIRDRGGSDPLLLAIERCAQMRTSPSWKSNRSGLDSSRSSCSEST